jgi:hypothetical protein
LPVGDKRNQEHRVGENNIDGMKKDRVNGYFISSWTQLYVNSSD